MVDRFVDEQVWRRVKLESAGLIHCHEQILHQLVLTLPTAHCASEHITIPLAVSRESSGWQNQH